MDITENQGALNYIVEMAKKYGVPYDADVQPISVTFVAKIMKAMDKTVEDVCEAVDFVMENR